LDLLTFLIEPKALLVYKISKNAMTTSNTLMTKEASNGPLAIGIYTINSNIFISEAYISVRCHK
jgi:hypothetical protein